LFGFNKFGEIILNMEKNSLENLKGKRASMERKAKKTRKKS